MTDARQDRPATRGPEIDLPAVGSVLKELFDRLTGEEAGLWLVAAKRFLRKEDAWGEFPTWKTVGLGMYGSIDELNEAIKETGAKITAYAQRMLDTVTLRLKPQVTLELVLVSGTQLGLEKGGTVEQIYAAGKSLGLDLCPPEVGALLRIKYRNQKKREVIRLAMEPIAFGSGYLGVFSVERDEGGLHLGISGGIPTSFYSPDIRWVFVRRKSVAPATK